MQVSLKIVTIAFLFFASISSGIYAQTPSTLKFIHDWYLEERFLIADQNDDALLELKELQQFSKEFVYYVVPRHFYATDLNQDGFLSFNEINKRVKSEYLYRFNMDRKQLRELSGQYTLLAQADEKYLKQRPELVKTLFGNLTWLAENESLAKELYKDKSWTQKNPEILIALHENLRWMTSNPADAKSLYQQKTVTRQLPMLLSWRADHNFFIRSNQLKHDRYMLNFLPLPIVNN